MSRREYVLAALTLAERLLAPAAAWLFFRQGLVAKVGATFVIGFVVAVRRLLQRAFAARIEADLLVRVGRAVLSGDVLRDTVLPDDDASVELGQAVFHTAQSLAHDRPALAADAIACALLTVVVALTEPPRLVSTALLLTLLAALILISSRNSVEGAVARAWRARQTTYAKFADALRGRLEIVASAQDRAFARDLQDRALEWGKETARSAAAFVMSGSVPSATLLAAVASAVALVFYLQHDAPHVSWADVAFLASTMPAFMGVAQDMFATTRARRWFELVSRVLVEAESHARASQAQPPTCPSPSPLVFERVSFRYVKSEYDRPALRDVSFRSSDRILALVGPNGSGKSTCLRLLLGLAEPQSGQITIGGIPLDQIDLEAWRAKVAFLPQRPYLPPASDLRSAIRLIAPSAEENAIRCALDRVGLLGALSAQPDPLSVRVDSLSVGQRQRVALARILCRNASVLLLDEPDANLDRAGVGLVAGIVRDLSTNATVIIAAHTEELLGAADRIIYLERGQIVRDDRRDAPLRAVRR